MTSEDQQSAPIAKVAAGLHAPAVSIRAKRRNRALLLIVVLTWFANFLHFSQFGFYEDDWYFFAPPYVLSTAEWFHRMAWAMESFQLGRPMQNFFMYTCGWVGSLFPSIQGVYLLSFTLFTVSAVLMYYVLRRRFPTLFCTLATLLYVVSPLTSIRQFLNGQLTLAPAFIFIFAAILINRRRRVLSYALALLALMTYESVFILFLAAPFFQKAEFGRKRIRAMAIHVGISSVLTSLYLVVRSMLAESRLAAASHGPVDTILSTIECAFLFTLRSTESYIYAIYVGVRELSVDNALYVALLIAPALAWLLWRSAGSSALKPFGGRGFGAARRRWWFWNGIVAGVLLTLLGYVLSYIQLNRNWVYPLSGRDTRVSSAATFGSSFLVAACLMFLMTVFRGHRLRIAARVFTISFLCAIFSYAFVVQSDYVTAWDHEKSFLTQAIMLSPDVYPDTLFVVEGTSLGEPLFPDPGLARRPSIGFQRHGLEVSMQSLFGHDAPTAFFCYSPEWKHYLQFRPDGKLHWTQARFDGGWSRNPDEPITPGHIIVLEERLDGIVLRKSVALKVDDRSVEETLDLPSVMKLESSWPKMPASPILPQVVAPYVMSATMVDGSEEPFLSARMSRPPLAAVRNSRDTAADGSAPAAQNNSDPPLISPAAGTVLIKSPVTFAWDAVAGAKDYWLDIGTVAGQGNIWSGFTGGATSRTVDVGKYLTGEPLYVQLYPKLTSAKLIPGAGRKYRFATQTTNVQLIAPPIGTTLTTSPVTFTWTLLQGAEDYWIDVGTAVGKGNIFAGYTKGANSATVNLRPYLNGKPLYVQLYAKFPGQAPPTPGTGTKFVYNTR